VYRITLETPNPEQHRSRNEAIRAHAGTKKEQEEKQRKGAGSEHGTIAARLEDMFSVRC
jgi:hypothetical protein